MLRLLAEALTASGLSVLLLSVTRVSFVGLVGADNLGKLGRTGVYFHNSDRVK